MDAAKPSVRRMTGRNPDEAHRVATPLELLYDLCYAVAFGIAGSQFAHLFSQHEYAAALLRFSFSMIAICWAWIQFSWFASAYDTNDLPYQLTVMMQMVGVVVVALGLPAAFHSIEGGEHLDNSVMVAGYVVIRVAQLINWSRVAHQSPQHRRQALTYMVTIGIAQLLWVALAWANPSLTYASIAVLVVMLFEISGPVIAETVKGGTPWHPHHIAERYSLLAIITMGEGVIGTVASVNAANADVPWTWESILLVIAGLLLVFGMWFCYFTIPSGEILQSRRASGFVFGYGHVLIFAAIAASGAALHIAGYTLEKAEHHVTGFVATLVLVTAVGLYLFGLYALYSALMRSFDPFHLILVVCTTLVLVAALVLAAVGVALPWCLLTVALAPVVTIAGYEIHGRHYTDSVLTKLNQTS